MAKGNKFTKRKKGIRGKLSSLFKKAAVGAGVLTAAAGIGYVQYGTVETKICKVNVEENVDYDKNWNSVTTYKITACGEEFNDKAARLHGKFSGDKLAEKMYNDGNYAEEQSWRITYYGGLIRTPNLLNAKHLTEAEVKAIQEREKAAKEKTEKPKAEQPGQPAQPAAPGQPVAPGLSGDLTTYNVTVGGYTVRITVPVEVKSQVTINEVKPATSAPAPSGP